MASDRPTDERPTDPLDVVETPPPARVPPVVVPRWVQAVLLPLALVAAYGLVRAAGPIALLFTIAALIALLLNPFVTLLRRRGVPRGLSVLAVLLTLLIIVGGVGTLLASPIADQVTALQRNVPDLVDNANAELADLQGWLDRKNVDVQVKEPGETALQTVGEQITQGSGDIIAVTRDALTLIVEASIALILIVVLTVYMLLYGERIGEIVRGMVPRGDGSPADDFPTRIQAAVLGYVRGQLLFCLIMGVSCGVMLYVLGSVGIFEEGKTYALFFGAFYGIAELIPYVGPVIGGSPAGLIALFGPDPLDALWLFFAFTALQQLEGHVVAPQVFGHSLRINPLLVILALLMGGQLYGIVGAFIALPLAAILRETAVYLRRHLVLEPWPTRGPELVGAGIGAVAHGPPPDDAPRAECPECGTTLAPDATACHACGTELGDAAAASAAASSAPG